MTEVIDRSTTTTLDALQLARGWRAVACASGKEADRPALYHTVCLEQYEQGLRLVATDSYRLLVCWVPAEGYLPEEEPDLGELPHASAVAIDQWGRARSLLAYMAQQAAKEENDGLTVLLRLGVPWQSPETPEAELQFDGLQALAVDLEYVHNERLQLPVYEGGYPSWRNILHDAPQKASAGIVLQQQNLAAITKAAGIFGEETTVTFRFGGEERPVGIEFGADPRVRGLVMPCRWQYETDAPEPPPPPPEPKPAQPARPVKHLKVIK